MLVRLRIGHGPYVNDVPDADEGPPNPLDESPAELVTEDSHPAARHPVVVELDLRTLVGIAVTMLVAFAIVALFQGAPATITRLAIALLFALALDPLVVAAQRRFRLGRRSAVGLVGSVFAIGVFVMVLVVGPAAVREARKFGDQLPQTVQQLYDIPIVGHRLRDADAAGQVTKWLEDLPARVDTGDIVSVAETLVGGAAATLTVVVFVLALLLDGEVLVRRLRNLVPESRRGSLDRLGTLFYATVGNYFAGSIFVAVLDGAVVLVLGLLLGVPLAPVAAIWAMVTNLIPQIGGFLGGSFFVLLALSASPTTGLLALVLFVAYLQIENNIIQPAIVGQSMNLSPPTTMIAALIGGAVAGVPGALAVTPLVGTAKAIYKGVRGEEVPVATTGLRMPFRLHLPFRRKRADTEPPGPAS